MLEQLAKQYAEMRGTTLLTTHIDGEYVIFVLESGQKLKMTAKELQHELEDADVLAVGSVAAPVDAAPADAPHAAHKKKGKAK